MAIAWVSVAVPQELVTEYEMITVPDIRPFTTPEPLTVAAAGVLLLHVPPAVASLKVMEELMHTLAGPVMIPALGKELTVMG